MAPPPGSVAAAAKALHSPPIHTQLAALCHRKGKSGKEVLLVTSSNGRWILPKGWPIEGKKPSEAAMVEAWEEAGVKKGKVDRKPMGSFVGLKRYDNGNEVPCLTKVFAVKVQKTTCDYPESDRRDRIWVSPKKAAKLVDEAGLKDILAEF
jgi:8-oxo-dGTP pyrophosphatase MutT (NUDIX family)